MSSYNPALLTPKDQVRSLIRDITPPFVFTDREIQLALENESNIYRAAARLCRMMVLEAGGMKKSESLGDRSVTYRDPAEWAALANDLWMRGSSDERISVGGISYADKCRVASNPDHNLGSFRRGQFEDPQGRIGGRDS